MWLNSIWQKINDYSLVKVLFNHTAYATIVTMTPLPSCFIFMSPLSFNFSLSLHLATGLGHVTWFILEDCKHDRALLIWLAVCHLLPSPQLISRLEEDDGLRHNSSQTIGAAPQCPAYITDSDSRVKRNLQVFCLKVILQSCLSTFYVPSTTLNIEVIETKEMWSQH